MRMSVRRQFFDITPPTAPGSPAAQALNETTIRVTWTAASDSGTGIFGYRIYRSTTSNGTYALIGSVGPSVLQLDDTSLSGSLTRFYRVTAVDRTPNESAVSATVSATTPDSTAPTTPSMVSVTATGTTTITAVWSASTDQGGSGLQGYRVYRNGALLPGIVAGTTFNDTGLTPGTLYTYQAQAIDNASNTSGISLGMSATTQLQSSIFPFTASGRQLRNSQNAPVLLHGDTPWLLMTGWTDAEVTQYLNDRASRGVNALICELIEHFFTVGAPNTVTGLAPFSTPNDIRTPLDPYFNRVVSIALQARAKNMVLLMTPTYYGFDQTQEGWWPQAISTRTVAECQAFGAYVGTKFAAVDNIIWVMGGDYWTSATNTRTDAIVAGLKSTGHPSWLFTYHADRGNNSSDVVNASTWLNLDAVYTDDQNISIKLVSSYGKTPNRPFMHFEGYYEGEGATAQELRAQAYLAILTGGTGAFFGNSPIWKAGFGWQTALSSSGMADRVRWQAFFSAIAWQSLVPDRNNTVLTAGQGTLAQQAYAARMSDGSKIIVYTPIQKQLTIALSQLVGASSTAAWYNPSTGATTAAGNFGVTGTQNFTPPSAGDWVLILTAVQAALNPLFIGDFSTGTIGALANTEYQTHFGPGTVYANDVPGPKGETQVGKVLLSTSTNFYGSKMRPRRAINTQVGAETWFRAFSYFRSQFCAGGQNVTEAVNGSLKWWRWEFDTSNRLTLLLGDPDGGSGIFLPNACPSPATAPILGLLNSEIGGTPNNKLTNPRPVMTRDTWLHTCVYVLWGNPGRIRIWHEDILKLDQAVVTRPVGSFDVLTDGFWWPGDYYNGRPLTSEAMQLIAQMMALDSSSPPPWFDPLNPTMRFIPKSVDVRDYL